MNIGEGRPGDPATTVGILCDTLEFDGGCMHLLRGPTWLFIDPTPLHTTRVPNAVFSFFSKENYGTLGCFCL